MKRYAICGVSNRALQMFIRPIVEEFSKQGQVVVY